MALTRRGAVVLTGLAGLAGGAWLLQRFGLVSTDLTSLTGPVPAKAKAPMPMAPAKGPAHKVEGDRCEGREFEEGQSNRTKSSNKLQIERRSVTFRGKTKSHTIRFEDDWDLIGWGARDQTCGKGTPGTYTEVRALDHRQAVLIDRGSEWVIVVGGHSRRGFSRSAARLTKEQFDDLSARGPKIFPVYTAANPKTASLGMRIFAGRTDVTLG